MIEEDFSMSRDSTPEELGNKPNTKWWEYLLYLALLAALFAGEIYVINPR